MCGIAGIYNYGDSDRMVDQRLLRQMTRLLRHRGPDAEGFFIDGAIGFGHRRLSIVDLTPTGDQPMKTPDGRFCITYNGEFYNHRTFRPLLEGRGVTFRGTSDTETLLYLVAEYGPDALEKTAGIFAFGLWDAGAQRLILARDPLGVKQIYYHDDGKRIIFASEIKALLLDPVIEREVDAEAVNDYLHFHTPLFERTFFRGIHVVEPGTYLVVDRHGVRPKRYWSVEGFAPRTSDSAEQVRELTDLLQDVVRDQLMSDVPVGVFFSGGIDSSAVATYAKRAGKTLTCFGVHFSNQGVVDERPYQEQAARAIGFDLELTTLDGSTFPEDMRRLIYQQDQPVIGAALLSMDAVSRLASRKVKVCLGGQAADEIFGGYARYALAHSAQVIETWFSGRRAVTNVGDGSETRVGGNLVKQLFDRKNINRLIRNARYALNGERLYFEHFANVPGEIWRAVFPQSIYDKNAAWRTFQETLRRSPSADPGQRIMHWDMQTYLCGLFQQDDRMSMGHSLESRVPLADPRLVRFAFHTPFEMKLRGGATKWILRQAVAGAIPALVLNRRKVGFDTPAERWMRGQHRDFVTETLTSSSLRSRGFWDADSVARIVRDTASGFWFDAVWKLLSIELWSQVFLDDRVVTPEVEAA